MKSAASGADQGSSPNDKKNLIKQTDPHIPQFRFKDYPDLDNPGLTFRTDHPGWLMHQCRHDINRFKAEVGFHPVMLSLT